MENISNTIWERLNTLSQDAQAAAIAKATELNYDINKGVISMEESLINLNGVIASLRDAINQNKLQQLPLSIQKAILSELDRISKFLAELIAGTDNVVNLVDSIESLYSYIWQLGIQKLSNEYLGYETKLNQIKNLELRLQKLREQFEQTLPLESRVKEIVENAAKTTEAFEKVSKTAENALKESAEHLRTVSENDQKGAALLQKIEQSEQTTSDLKSDISKKSSDISALKSSIDEFYEKVEEYQSEMETAKADAKSAVAENAKKTKDLIAELENLEGQIRKQIQRATGHSLFHSFQTRQRLLSFTKYVWVAALAALVSLTIWYTLNLATEMKGMKPEDFNYVIYLKLSLSVPMAFAIIFCTVQYNRERRLEEEYAFKSNISISLLPYQELIEKLVGKDEKAEKEKFTAFIIDSVSRVFTSPTDKIFDAPQKDSSDFDKTLKRVGSLVRQINKATKQ